MGSPHGPVAARSLPGGNIPIQGKTRNLSNPPSGASGGTLIAPPRSPRPEGSPRRHGRSFKGGRWNDPGGTPIGGFPWDSERFSRSGGTPCHCDCADNSWGIKAIPTQPGLTRVFPLQPGQPLGEPARLSCRGHGAHRPQPWRPVLGEPRPRPCFGRFRSSCLGRRRR